MRPDELRGVIPAIATPFDEDQNLDLDGLSVLTDFVISEGVHAIMTTGGTGEFPSLTRDERRLVTEAVVEQAAGRIPIIAGTAACGTRETIQLTQDAKDVGAAAAIITAPYYFQLPQAALLEHYQTIARSVDLPVVLYNNPLYTGNNLSPALIAELAEEPGIIGLKQSNADMGQLVEVIRLVGDKISVCTGIDSQFYPALCMGAKGIFSTAAVVVPREMVSIYDGVNAGAYDEARSLHLKLQELNGLFEYDPGYVAPCKEALRLLGLPGGPVRKPLPELTSDERRRVLEALQGLGKTV